MNKRNLFTLILFLICHIGFSQFKFEREYQISEDKVPKKALKFIEKVNFKKRVKWYVEESQEGKTFEAKVQHDKKKHSLEFKETGEIIDVEIKVRFSKLNSKTKENLKKLLKKRFKKFGIKKVQIQYRGEEKDLISCLNYGCNLKPNYELIIKGKKNKRFELYELLFGVEGEKLLKELKFIPDNFDNLEF